VLGTELFECGAGGLGHIGRALIDQDLESFSVVDGLAQGGNDLLGALVIVDDDGVEQILIAIADVLRGDEFEGDTEGLEVGGIGGELGVGNDDIEGEAPSPTGALAWRCGWREGSPHRRGACGRG
jgi:hypothetical protein